MWTMDLAELLEMRSGDAECYDMCRGCGTVVSNMRFEPINHHVWCAGEEMQTCTRVGEILPHKRRNPGYPRLRAAVLSEGFTTAILVDVDDEGTFVVNGHHRLAVLSELGVTEVTITDDYDYEPGDDWCI